MSIKKHIAILNSHLSHWQRLLENKICDIDEGESTIEALKMAIELLESEPCNDCISREHAVYMASGNCHPQNIADELRKMPSVKPANVNFYGMTVEAERRVMKNALRLIREVIDDYTFGCDSGSDDWREFFKGYSDDLDEAVERAEYPSDLIIPNLPSDEWLFKNLISWGTTKGGMGSAIDECRKIGKVMQKK